ncbi:MAG: GNAT family N-acetyltransferase [Solirubrobacteraceae bacterium]
MNELARWRNLLGASTRVWAGAQGVTLSDSRWWALSGAPSVEYNVALCHGDGGAADIEETLEAVAAAKVPAIVMVAGQALADAQTLVGAQWICIGATPFMALDLEHCGLDAREPDPQVRRLGADELPAARALLQEAFALPPELSSVALPDASVGADGQALWGLFEGAQLLSCAAFVTVEEAIVGWSVATPARLQRRGYGARLLRAVLEHGARQGVTLSLVYSSAAGERLYRTLGFRELERWQMWSRPRWVLART